jgi:hypothetical protein
MSITATIPGGAVQLTGNQVRIYCTGGAAPVNSSEYEIMCKVISQDGKLPGAPFIDSVAPNSNGEAVFDISGYVDQPLPVVFQWPVNGAINAYPTQAFNIQVQVGERYIDSDDLLHETWGATSEVFQMLKGGLSPRQVAVMKDAGFTCYTKYIQAGKFLTAREWGGEVHPLQPVKLWFIPDTNIMAALSVAGYYDDGSSVVKTAPVFLQTDYLYEFNVNPVQLGHTLEPTGKQMLYFDVWVESSGNLMSESRRFQIDWRYCERPVFLMFANSFGGIDDVYLSGYIQDKFQSNGAVSYRPQQETDTVYTPTMLSLDKTGRNRWSINTGDKSLTHIQYLRDLLVAKQAWYLYTNLSQSTTSIIPITEISAGEILINRMEDNYSLQIDFAEAHESKFSFDNRSF